MPSYTYRAVNLDGQEQTGVFEAPDRDALTTRLAARGEFVVEAEESAPPRPKTRSTPSRMDATTFDPGDDRDAGTTSRRPSRHACRRSDLIQFTISLQTMVDAGVSLLTGLHYIEPQIRHPRLHACVQEIITDLEQGTSFADALRRHPYVFPRIYVETVAGAEESGKLDDVLEDLVNNLEWTQEMVSTLRKALAYPIFLIVAVVLASGTMLMFVVPRFTAIFTKMGAKMPTPTRILDVSSRTLVNHFTLIVGGVGVLLAGLVALRFSARGRLWLARGFRRLPLLGAVVRTIALSRLCRGLSVLLDAGVHIGPALRLGEAIADDPLVGQAVQEALRRMERGDTMEEAFHDLPGIPDMISFMVATGEKTGRLSYTLQKAGAHLERQSREGVARLLALLEPTLIVGLGVIVGGMAACMLLGMYSLMEAVRNGQ